ncbi:hypothetical protein CEUSTIGMA_g12829.t1, partial [Chlamydomonas eustigma]
ELGDDEGHHIVERGDIASSGHIAGTSGRTSGLKLQKADDLDKECILRHLGLDHLISKAHGLDVMLLPEQIYKQKHSLALTCLDKDVTEAWALSLQLEDVSDKNVVWVTEFAPRAWKLQALWLHTASNLFDADKTFSSLMQSRESMTKVSRSYKKTASTADSSDANCCTYMWTSGLTCPLNDNHLPGRFKREKESNKATSLINAAFSSLADAWLSVMPIQAMRHTYVHCPTDMLLAGKGMTNYSMTVNYKNKYHVDESDAPGSCIFWFQEGCFSKTKNGLFQLPSIGICMRPSHSSFLYFDTSTMVHGTGPGSENKGNLHGVAFYCKPTVVSRIRKVLHNHMLSSNGPTHHQQGLPEGSYGSTWKSPHSVVKVAKHGTILTFAAEETYTFWSELVPVFLSKGHCCNRDVD